MTAKYRRTEVGLWVDDRFDSLSESAKLLWLFFLTGPLVTNLPGIILVGKADLADRFRWTVTKLEEAFGELEASKNEEGVPLAKADWAKRIVLLPNGFKHNVPMNVNMVRSWAVPWKLIPSCQLKHEAHEALYQGCLSLGDQFSNAAMASLGGFPKQINAPKQLPKPLSPVDLSPETTPGNQLQESEDDCSRVRARACVQSPNSVSVSKLQSPDSRRRPVGDEYPTDVPITESVLASCEMAAAPPPTQADVVEMLAWHRKEGKRSNDWEASLVWWMGNAKRMRLKGASRGGHASSDAGSIIEALYGASITRGRGAAYSCPQGTEPLLRRTFADQGIDGATGNKLGEEDLEPWLSAEAETFARWLLKESKTDSKMLQWYSDYGPKGFQKRMNEIGSAEAARNGAA